MSGWGRLPSVADLMRMPAGERGPRLRELARWHSERAAVLEAAGSAMGATRHRNALAKIECMTRIIGLRASINK